jgi:DNA-binding CsgD family transcriptional regulator/PAS domain-containing protein
LSGIRGNPGGEDIALAEPDGLRPVLRERNSDWVNEDLIWIINKFAGRVLADCAALTVHRDDSIELVVRTSCANDWSPSDTEILSVAEEAAAFPFFFSQPKQMRLSWISPPASAGIGKALVVETAEQGDIRLVVSAFYRRSNFVQDFTAEQMAKKLLPVLGGYFRLWLFARHEERKLNAFRSALDLSDAAVIILDDTGAVTGENSAATAMFTRSDVLRKLPRALVAMSRGDTSRLNEAIDHATCEGRPSAISLDRKGRGRPLTVVISPISRRPEISSDPSVILCVYDSIKDLSAVLNVCCNAYSLTRTEARLVEHLVEGRTTGEAASKMRIAEATARSYLKQIFAKTQTSRQTDLVRVMLLSIARTSCSEFHEL